MFSVIIPVYNHVEFLRQAVCSALRAPLVTEVLLLDDGSSDGSTALADRLTRGNGPRVRNLTPPAGGNLGAHHRLNTLAEAAACEWIAVLNSDDVFVNGRFEAIRNTPGFDDSDFVFGNLLFINETGTLTGSKFGPFSPGVPFPPALDAAQMIRQGSFLELLAHQNYLGTTSNMVFRKSLFSRVGRFAGFRYVHDWDFALRAMILGQPLYVQRFLTAYRIHSHNTIAVDAAAVDKEAAQLFASFLKDFPDALSRDGFRLGLQFNVNGVRPPAPAVSVRVT